MFDFGVDVRPATFSVRRRGFLCASLAGGAALSRAATGRAALAQGASNGTAVIQIWLGGGPSHLDMYDLKPQAPAEFRGPFRPIATSVPGIEICELLPLQARRMDRLSIVRSLHHGTSEHPAGAHWTLTGHPGAFGSAPRPSRPSAGSVVARLRGANRAGMPPYLHIAPDPMGFPIFIRCHESAYLGPQFSPLLIRSARKVTDINRATLDNLIGKVQFELPDVAPVPGLDAERIGQRVELNRKFSGAQPQRGLRTADAEEHFQRQALELVASGAAREAFDLDREPDALRERYGRNVWGQGALLCRRLVEAGATFVTLNTDSFSGQWDNHGNLPGQFGEMLPVYDRMLTALLDDLESRGLERKVAVVVWGEFGRTPRINAGAGRDHWGPAAFALLAGGGLRGGQVVGSTTRHGEEPKDRPIWPGDVWATLYQVLGIDPDTEFNDHSGRPIKVLAEGRPISELV